MSFFLSKRQFRGGYVSVYLEEDNIPPPMVAGPNRSLKFNCSNKVTPDGSPSASSSSFFLTTTRLDKGNGGSGDALGTTRRTHGRMHVGRGQLHGRRRCTHTHMQQQHTCCVHMSTPRPHTHTPAAAHMHTRTRSTHARGEGNDIVRRGQTATWGSQESAGG